MNTQDQTTDMTTQPLTGQTERWIPNFEDEKSLSSTPARTRTDARPRRIKLRGAAEPTSFAAATTAQIARGAGAPAAAGVAAQAKAPASEKHPVSMSMVVGSVLSAVTSLLLSSSIGIGGSLIGIAVGAGVSSIATQLYTHLASKAGRKLKDVAENSSLGSQQLTGIMDSSQLDTRTYSMDADVASADANGAGHTPYVTPELHRMAKEREAAHAAKLRKRALIITVVASLAVVLLTAVIVNVATQGSGIGPKTQSIISMTATDEAESTDTSAKDSEGNNEGQNQGAAGAGSTDADSTNASSTDASDSASSSSDSSASTTDTSTSGSSDTSSSNSSSSGSNSGTSSDTNAGTGSDTSSSSNSSTDTNSSTNTSGTQSGSASTSTSSNTNSSSSNGVQSSSSANSTSSQ